MKRLILIASLCITAVVVAPIASASAEGAKFAGKCEFKGTATFAPGNLSPVPAALEYKFKGTAECETQPGKEKLKGKVEVSGKGTLSCGVSLGLEGAGTLKLSKTGTEPWEEYEFKLTIVSGAPGTVLLAAKFKDGSVAVGFASFLKSETEPAAQCFTLEGAHALEFEAMAAGEV
jgi:hypothetical protein